MFVKLKCEEWLHDCLLRVRVLGSIPARLQGASTVFLLFQVFLSSFYWGTLYDNTVLDSETTRHAVQKKTILYSFICTLISGPIIIIGTVVRIVGMGRMSHIYNTKINVHVYKVPAADT